MSGWLFALIAIVGGTVHTGDGEVITNGTVLMENGRITAVGGEMDFAAIFRVIDARGKTVTPGLIDPNTGLGLVEIWGAPETNDSQGEGDPIRSAYRAIDALNPDSRLIPIQRAHGITTVISAPGGGLIGGQSALISLTGEEALMAPASISVNLGGRRKGSRGQAIADLREVLDDARTYGKNKKAFERNAYRRLAASRLDLEALQPVLAGDVPLQIRVDRRSEILAVLRLAEEMGVKVILVGAAEAWLVAERIAQAGVPVIYDPILNAPEAFDRLYVREDAPRVLLDAGVTLAFSTMDTHDVRTLRQSAGNAVRAGLRHAEALKAVTSTPATLYGQTDRGVLRAGAVADVVVWSGDPFELSSRAEHVIIDGKATPLDHRQHALTERYRVLPERIRPSGPEQGEKAAGR